MKIDLKAPRQRVIGLWLFGLWLFGALAAPAMAQGTWTPTANLMTTRRDAHAALLVNGKVLVIGGRVSTAGTTTVKTDYYNPATGTFTATGSMVGSRSFFPPVALDNGKILAPGGYRQGSFSGGTTSYSELFDPAKGTWANTGRMTVARELGTATKLPDGRVLVVGGFSNNTVLRSAEIYNPATGAFTATASMRYPRDMQAAVFLGGKVFVLGGGADVHETQRSTEYFDPATSTWWDGPPMNQSRRRHTVTLLQDGRLLVTGGYSAGAVNCLDTAEIYDPATGTFTLLASRMSDVRMDHTATLLNDGRVLLVGGWSSVKGSTVASADLFDPATNVFTPVASLPVSRHEHTATLLPSGQVLLAGGLRWEPTIQETRQDAYVFTAPTAPPAPVGLTATGGNTKVNLSWTASSGATSYTIYSLDPVTDRYVPIATDVTTTSYTDTGLTNGVTYYYVVTAVNSIGESANSAQVSATPQAPPTAPTNLTATGASSSQIDLQWTDNSDSEAGFAIERSPDSTNFTQIATVGADVSTFSDTGLSAATIYYYRVLAFNDGGPSDYSNMATASTNAGAPLAPTGLSATAGNAQVSLAWSPSSGATSYSVKRSTQSGGPFTVVATGVGGTAYTDTTVSNGTMYYYVVSAISLHGESANSTQASALPRLTAPSALSATSISRSRIDLAWTTNTSNEAGFRIERSQDGVNFMQIATVAPSITTYSSTGLKRNTTYYYRVLAFSTNAAGNSTYSNIASARTKR